MVDILHTRTPPNPCLVTTGPPQHTFKLLLRVNRFSLSRGTAHYLEPFTPCTLGQHPHLFADHTFPHRFLRGVNPVLHSPNPAQTAATKSPFHCEPGRTPFPPLGNQFTTATHRAQNLAANTELFILLGDFANRGPLLSLSTSTLFKTTKKGGAIYSLHFRHSPQLKKPRFRGHQHSPCIRGHTPVFFHGHFLPPPARQPPANFSSSPRSKTPRRHFTQRSPASRA